MKWSFGTLVLWTGIVLAISGPLWTLYSPRNEPFHLEVLTGTEGGEYAQLGNEIEKFLHPDPVVQVILTHGAIDNVNRAIANQGNRILLAYVSVVAMAEQEKDKRMALKNNMRVVATLYDEAYYLLCRTDICQHTGDVCQLAAKRVYGGRLNSGTRYVANKIRESNECLRALDFKAYGSLSFQSAADFLNAGDIDAAFFSIRDGANLVLKVEPRDIVAIELEPFLKDFEDFKLGDSCMARYGNNSKLTTKTKCSKALLLASKNLSSSKFTP